MSGSNLVRRFAEWLIRAACRRLPADVRSERRREWTAELPAILEDESIRPSFLRALRALAFCVGISRTTRQLRRSARAGSRRTRNAQWRNGALRTRPNEMAVRVAMGLAVWLVFVAGVIALVTMVGTSRDPHPWTLLVVAALGVGFAAFCLVDIARADDVRYLSKGIWAFICLIQIPLGGILYLTIGRIDPPRTVPPNHTRS